MLLKIENLGLIKKQRTANINRALRILETAGFRVSAVYAPEEYYSSDERVAEFSDLGES